MTAWLFGSDGIARMTLGNKIAQIPVPLPSAWIEACQGFGCGQARPLPLRAP